MEEDENTKFLMDNTFTNTSINISLRQKLLLKKYNGKKYPRFCFSEWIRENLTEEEIKRWIKKHKK